MRKDLLEFNQNLCYNTSNDNSKDISTVIDLKNIHGITNKIVATAILLARKGNNVLIVSTQCRHIMKQVTTNLSYIPPTATTDCKIGWIQAILDAKDMFLDLYNKTDNSVIIFDNYCLNFDFTNLESVKNMTNILTYDEIMKQEFEWI